MKVTLALILVVGVCTTLAKEDCWWTGCQPDHWGEKGCGTYDRDEHGREPCTDNNGDKGNKYKCCAKGTPGGTSTPAPGPTPSKPEDPLNLITEEQFQNATTSNNFPVPSREQFDNFNRFAKSIGKISSVQEAAMALAQFLHESDGLRAKREYACKDTQCAGHYATPKCDVPGQYYYGRGYIQLTWCYNYKPCSNDLFGDDRLVRDPDMVAKDDGLAWQTAFWFWGKSVHEKPGVQQGQFGATTKSINGAIECSSPGNTHAQKRFRIYGNVRQAFGLQGAGDPSGCA